MDAVEDALHRPGEEPRAEHPDDDSRAREDESLPHDELHHRPRRRAKSDANPDLLPALGNAVWNTSWLLTESSVPGKVLHALIGYVSRPAGIQVLFYVTTLSVIGLFTWLIGRESAAKPIVAGE